MLQARYDEAEMKTVKKFQKVFEVKKIRTWFCDGWYSVATVNLWQVLTLKNPLVGFSFVSVLALCCF